MLSLDSPSVMQLLSECKVAPRQFERLTDGTSLLNAGVTLVEGKEIAYCHTVKTNDGRPRFATSGVRLPYPEGRQDAFIGDLLYSPPPETVTLTENVDGAKGRGGGWRERILAQSPMVKPGMCRFSVYKKPQEKALEEIDI